MSSISTYGHLHLPVTQDPHSQQVGRMNEPKFHQDPGREFSYPDPFLFEDLKLLFQHIKVQALKRLDSMRILLAVLLLSEPEL